MPQHSIINEQCFYPIIGNDAVLYNYKEYKARNGKGSYWWRPEVQDILEAIYMKKIDKSEVAKLIQISVSALNLYVRRWRNLTLHQNVAVSI